ncbi:hypothetical protein K2173_010090 [Erythroxylum novogranatense]|uniref:BHLH domain-containing protein n=1 Tax=Erythroxylum novogranatense TaxID=1862640 RepID=A0AAV8TVG9_9ROSI|nr:hypothetical protein K2173_010090 [Erythroxylum novogranatense]
MFYDIESRNFDKLRGALRKEQYKEKPKRTLSSETHNLCEKRRRERIKRKMKALQELLPGPRKYPSDSASMLDDAIEYLKTLKLQIKMMYMRGRFIFQVPSVLPTGFQMPQFAASAPGMGMGMVDLCNSGAISMMSIPPTYIQNSAAYGNLQFLFLN